MQPGRLVIAVALGLFASPALAQPEDAVTALIRDQTNIGSAAGQRGDQATADKLMDDQVLFSGGDGTVQRDPKLDANDAVSAALKALTERCHAQAGLARCALPTALFTDQTGAANPAGDFIGGPASVSDFIAHHTADVAVTSFTLQTAAAKVLAVEIWSHQGAQWRLVGGQTIPLNQDPPAVALPTETLDAYTGTYSPGPGSMVVITRDGDGLASSSNGGKPSPLKAEARDLFFTPGLPAGYLRPHNRFQRDAAGQIIGFERSGIQFKRMAAAAQVAAGPAPVAGQLVLRDFTVHRTGDIAVAAFFHDRDTPYFGQVLHQTYRSMEAWIKHDGTWKMISSQGRQM